MSNDEEQPSIPMGRAYDPWNPTDPHYQAVDAKLTTQETMTAPRRFRVQLSEYNEVKQRLPRRGPQDEWWWRVAASPMGIKVLDIILQRLVGHITDAPIEQPPKLTVEQPWDDG